ncbi:1-phosphofructokinase family hexose kinase [Frigidibacter sp.]|uniref:1-phosphofructokinase family hexose kinase n=1 Tax=Frigidibacter sp. TaxID=2586418 RepID=UPI00273735C5|nr:1-phosphofructokinase family hexose kinase [Frigidibacter sp.]MDP3342556.1 1-phosphofructokinase family hexose kinase [Frigidibacter sp.]
MPLTAPPPAPQILTVTLNPSLDLATSAAEVQPGPKLRCEAPTIDPGGGGINVARAIRILGGSATAFVAVAGPTGQQLLQLLAAAQVPVAPFEGPGETRQSLAVTDRGTGGQYRLMLPGPVWTASRAAAALTAITAAAQPGGFVILSGSQPPGLPDDFPARLSRRLTRRKARLILDTSGAALRRAASLHEAPLFALRMDTEEAEDLAGHPLPTRADSADFAQTLVRSGVATMVIVARGGDGSTLATEELRLHASGVAVPVKSSVGAGDSFLGAFTLALARGEDAGAALCKGSAAAASAVMTDATRLCTKTDAARLLKRVELSEV